MNIIIGVIAGVLAVLVVCQHVVIMKDRKMQHQMGHDELTDVCNWEHLLQKAEVLYRTDTPRYIIYSDIAEFKLINELFGRETGNRILQKQAEQMKRYASEGCVYGRLGEDHFVFIVEQDKFSEDILHACRQELQKQLSDSVYNIQVYYGISPEYLNIEITETTIMSDVPNVRQEIQKLQQSGFIVEMDDFGSGYSSLNTLKDIDVDILKIDMGFIRETSNGEKAKIILDAIVKMAKKLQMPVITEGVETAEQVHTLTKMGCDMFQGYYFSKPISVAAFEDAYLDKQKMVG